MSEIIARPRTEVPLIRIIRRALVAYTALAAISLKSALAYITASWLEFGLQFVWMVAFVYFSLAEPDLSSIVKQIYGGALQKEVSQ